ncbi:MAG: FtsW/RodA/SpoVE family cell cycle protein [Candidatus Aminicenantales bacterium]
MGRYHDKEIFRPLGFDKLLFAGTLALMGLGLLMVFSSSGVLAKDVYNQPIHYFLVQQAAGAVVGLALVLGIIWVRKPFYQNPVFVYGFVILTLALLALVLMMPGVGRTTRWLQFAGFRFQPSELAKISIVLFLAHYLSQKKDRLGEFRALLFPLVMLFLFILLIFKEPDYGTAFLILLVAGITLFLGGVKLWHFAILGGGFLLLFGFYLVQAPYRMERISTFLDPMNDPLDRGFQVIQSKLAVGSGGLFGVSLGHSSQKLFFLPCAHTDYIFAITGEELGILGTCAILLLFVLIFWRGLRISWKAPNLSSQLIAAGLTFGIFFQALLNISIVLGLAPPTGLPLPLISYGRSSLICTFSSIGILLHISQRKETTRRKK